MNLKKALAYTRSFLADNNIDEADLEGEVLLKYLLEIDRTQLFSNSDVELDTYQEKTLYQLLERRVKGEPSAYITGHREFFGLDFNIDRNVLIPRPETELLIEKAIELSGRRKISSIADAGTGSGAVAVSLALYLTAVLHNSIVNNHVSGRIKLLQGDILGPLAEKVDLVVANLPYVRISDIPNSGPMSYEPATALNGGPDGLDKLKLLFRQSGRKLNPGGCVLAEIGQGQAISLTDYIQATYPEAYIDIYKDLAGIERVIEFRLTRNWP